MSQMARSVERRFSAFIDSHDRYICESYRVRLVPSLTSLKLISPKFHGKGRVLLVGNPNLAEIVTEQPWNWNLPGAEDEVKNVGRILKSESIIGKDATTEEVLRHLKFACLVHITAQGNPIREL